MIHRDLITWLGEQHPSAFKAAYMSNMLHRMLEQDTFEVFIKRPAYERAIRTEFIKQTKAEVDKFRVRFDPVPRSLIRPRKPECPVFTHKLQSTYIDWS